MQRSLSSFPFAPAVKVRLIHAGFHATADLCDFRPLQLSKEAGISQDEAEEVLQAVRSQPNQGRAAENKLTALELLEREQTLGTIVTFCSELDCVLGGGVPVGKTSEICGVPGVGKTQLCIQLAVDVQIPLCFGGLGGQVVYIDTEGSFLVQRIVDMAKSAVDHCSLLAEDTEQREALKEFTVETILSNLFLFRCHDYVELLAEIYLLPNFLAQHPEVRLVVIDSIASPFRHGFEDLSYRTRLLSGLAQRLIQMATQQSVAVKVGGMLPRRESSCIGRASRDWHLSTSPQPIEKLLFVTRSLDKALEMSPQPITMRPQLTPLHFHLETHTSAPVWRKPD